jgi:hypothetical protein
VRDDVILGAVAQLLHAEYNKGSTSMISARALSFECLVLRSDEESDVEFW